MSHLVGTFQSMYFMENLVLDCAIATLPPSSESRVALPRLHTLEVTRHYEDIMRWLLEHLRVPAASSVIVTFILNEIPRSTTLNSGRPITHVLRSNIQASIPFFVDCQAAFVDAKPGSYSITADTATSSITLSCLSFKHVTNTSHALADLQHLFGACPLTHIHVRDNFYGASAKAWSRALAQFPQAGARQADGRPSPKILLASSPGDASSDPPGQRLLSQPMW